MGTVIKETEMEVKQAEDRIDYIDLMKGIAMILVIATHTLPLSARIKGILAGLHNPAFYFASGILFGLMQERMGEKEMSLSHIVKKKSVRIIYPFVIWTILYTVLSAGLSYSYGICFSGRASVLDAINRLWFLPVLFVAFLLICMMGRILVYRIAVMSAWGGVIFITSLYSSALSKIFFFSFLVWLGTLCVRVRLTAKITWVLLTVYTAICCFGGFVWDFFSATAATQAGYRLFLIYIKDTLGVFVMLGMVELICSRRKQGGKWIGPWIYIGMNTLYFYLLHNIPIYCFEYAGAKSGGVKCLCFVLAVVIPCLYVKYIKHTRVNRFLFAP